MTLVLLCSAAGAPGVTTTALAMTLTWPGGAVLVDADRNATQSILAGFLRGADAGGRGLTALARAHRERRSIAEELPANCLPLVDGDAPRRMLLPGFSQAGSATLFQSAWPELAENLRRLSRTDTAVIVDAGRVGEGVPGPLLAAADVTLLLTRSSLRALAATRIQLTAIQQRRAQLSHGSELGLVLLGEGNPYSSKEIEHSFGVKIWGVLPEEARSAAVWSDGEPSTRRQRNGPLARSITALVSRITAEGDDRANALRDAGVGVDGWSSSGQRSPASPRGDR